MLHFHSCLLGSVMLIALLSPTNNNQNVALTVLEDLATLTVVSSRATAINLSSIATTSAKTQLPTQ